MKAAASVDNYQSKNRRVFWYKSTKKIQKYYLFRIFKICVERHLFDEIDEGKDFLFIIAVKTHARGSYVWKYASKESKEQATCSICGKTFKISGGQTSSLKYHLDKVHDIIEWSYYAL